VGSGAWNKRVANLEELSYQDLAQVPVGYLYLVVSDSSQNGLWSIYSVTATKTFATLDLVRVQNFDTRRYWNHIDWYLPGYNRSKQIVATVAIYSDLAKLSVYQAPVGSSVRVSANSQGRWEIYLRAATDIYDRVAVQDGTIEISEVLWNYQLGRFGFDVEVFDAQYFDQEPVIETRKIIQAQKLSGLQSVKSPNPIRTSVRSVKSTGLWIDVGLSSFVINGLPSMERICFLCFFWLS
jgi:hypothetical protein